MVIVRRSSRALQRRGFTLIEAVMASGILFLIVVAVTSAVTSGQHHAYEARNRIAATLAAEDLMGRLAAVDYEDLRVWDGNVETAGTLTDAAGALLPPSMNQGGRSVSVEDTLLEVTELGIRLRGRLVAVQVFDADGRTLSELSRFVPEPQELE